MKKNLAALIAGLLFGLGLAISQMTNPAKVLNFLDITGTWDPTLAFVMGGAVLVTLISFRFILKQDRPLFEGQFHLPTRSDIDGRLLGGAALAFWLVPGSLAFQSDMPWPVFLVAGLIVGFGTRLGSGCTSGHGVCGLARLSPRSLASVATFMATGILTVFVIRHLLGGGA